MTTMNSYQSLSNGGLAWCLLVPRIQAGDADAVEQLYRELASLRYYFRGRIGNGEHEDAYQELILDLVGQIRRGSLREPDRLVGYARVIASRIVSKHIRCAIHSRNSECDVRDIPLQDQAENPETAAIRLEQMLIIKRVLNAMQPRDREAISRFYVDGQEAERICDEMGLTPTQFRLLKSRARARFVRLCEIRLARQGSAESEHPHRFGSVNNGNPAT